MKRSKRNFYLIAIMVLLLSGVITFMFCIFFTPKIYIEETEITLPVFETLELPKYKAYVKNKEVSKQVKITGKVNNKKLGNYTIKYEISNGIFHCQKKIIVHVVDEESPTLELVGEEEITVCPKKEYEEPGYQAQDNYDGDITDKVIIEKLENEIDYTITDSSGNITKKKRIIHKEDKTSPVLTLKGNQILTLYVGTNYVESGYQAIDNCDGDLTEKVKVTGQVNTEKTGSYTLTYQVQDSSQNESQITRTINVITPSKNNQGIIYLTFDDGPSSTVTNQILDILKEEQVKATFFVINHSDNLNYLIKREFDEGHTVALHSYSHNYKEIYQSSESYFNDLEKIKNKVYQITGERSQIIRFPGGSSNTISKNYNQGIMSRLTKEVVDRGYHYFDWNVSSGDAGIVKSSEEVYQNVKEGLSKNRINVVLMHDFENNYYTLNALKKIIQYGKANGYTFQKITMEVPMVTHKVSN